MFTLETNLNRLFKTNAKLDNISSKPDTQIIFYDTPYIFYPQTTLDDNFLACFNAIFKCCSALRTGDILPPYQQSFEINVGTKPLKFNLCGLQKQIKWPEISLVFDKSDQHQAVYNSYDIEQAAKNI